MSKPKSMCLFLSNSLNENNLDEITNKEFKRTVMKMFKELKGHE